MRIAYRPAAVRDLEKTSDYIRDILKNPIAANNLRTKVLHGISLLKDTPLMGALLNSKFEDAPPDIRFLVIRNQMVFYTVEKDTITILRILDGRTDYISHIF